MRTICLLLVALFGTSCVPPSCFNRVFLPRPKFEHFATIDAYSKPSTEPPECTLPGGKCPWLEDGTRFRVYDWFERGAYMKVDDGGTMTVSTDPGWPRGCPRVAREDLDDVSRQWKAVLDWLVEPRVYLRFMANPEIEKDDWRPDGPLLELSFGSAGESVSFLWDGESSLPPKIDTAVVATLELMCSNSRLARRYLLRDLPPQVATRLACS